MFHFILLPHGLFTGISVKYGEERKMEIGCHYIVFKMMQ